MSISDTGFWVDVDFKKEHCYDEKLSHSICMFLKDKKLYKIYDFGCGPGEYVKKMRANGIESTGYDGNPITSSIPYCNVADLTDPKFILPPVDCVMCLEVGEHIPKQYESILIQTLDKHVLLGGYLILSWAVPGQGGFGHVNCQPNEYIRNKIIELGYKPLYNVENTFRQNASLSWFKNTILVFQKNPALHVNLDGGLGNCLFKLANITTMNQPYCICNYEHCDNKHSKINFQQTIFKNFQQKCNYISNEIFLENQNYNQIKEILPKFIDKLSFSNLEPETDTAFLHIRGGDYIDHPFHHIPLELYYLRAIQHFPKDTLFYIFTNDVEYAKQQPVLKHIRYEFIECNELIALEKMKQCKRGGICANSSFSWWGAILDTNRTLVIPNRWTTSEEWNKSSEYSFPGAIVESVSLDIYCIHLPFREDRLEHIQRIQKNYPNLNIHIIDGVYDIENGARGCLLSHKKIVQFAKENDLPYIFVIEDDCEFLLPNTILIHTIADMISYIPNVDIINGCGNLIEFKIDNVVSHGNTYFLKSPDVRTTHCILYGKSSYDTFLSFPDTSITDVQINTTNLVYTYPYLAKQLSSYSDITKENVEYTNIQKSNIFVKNYLKL